MKDDDEASDSLTGPVVGMGGGVLTGLAETDGEALIGLVLIVGTGGGGALIGLLLLVPLSISLPKPLDSSRSVYEKLECVGGAEE